MILTVTPNPSVDKVFEVPGLSPGHMNRIVDTTTQPGGKGVNVSFMLKVLEHDVTAMGFAGNGPGRFIQNSLRDAGITTAFTLIGDKTRTNYSIFDPTGNELTVLRSAGPQVDGADIADLRSAFERLVQMAEIVVIAGSLPPGVQPSLCYELSALAASHGVRVALNMHEDLLEQSLAARPFLAVPDLRNTDTYGTYNLTAREDRITLAQAIAGRSRIAVIHAQDEVLCASGDELLAVGIPACALTTRLRLDDALLAGMVDAACQKSDLAEIAHEGVAAALAAAASPTGQFTSPDEIQSCIERVEVIRLA